MNGEGLQDDVQHGPVGGKFSLGLMSGGNATEEAGNGLLHWDSGRDQDGHEEEVGESRDAGCVGDRRAVLQGHGRGV